ncbi:MAG TPA: hypothetical protein VN663_14420 [Ramlibacter sp.]|nr:hypothetical protein [Ramlibacter sp.]
MTIVIPTSGNPGKTFLQLAQRLRQEVQGAGTGPTTVLNQTGEYKRIVDWIAEADEEIQQEHDTWKFMVGNFALNTVVGDASYTPADCLTPFNDFRQWRQRTVKCYNLTAGVNDEIELNYIDYESWYVLYNTRPQTNSRPIHWTTGNQNELLIGPLPNDVYRVSGEYHRNATEMVADSEYPKYPSEYHMLPVYLAMMKYGRFTGASEVFADGERLYKKMLHRMERTQLPRFNSRQPLA